jgi:hypothetical protein
MDMTQLRKLCFERKVSTKKEVEREDKNGELYYKVINCTKGDLVSRLKNRVGLKHIISFAQRYKINIKDVLAEREKKRQEWEQKKFDDKYKKDKSNFGIQLEKAIREYEPPRQYDTELYYQDGLASWLKRSFPSTKIEVSRKDTRPDIVVRGIAIEIKGPTGMKELHTIPDKCIRYPKYFPRLIYVFFNVLISQERYMEWLQDIKGQYPDIIFIQKY